MLNIYWINDFHPFFPYDDKGIFISFPLKSYPFTYINEHKPAPTQLR